TPRRGAGVLGGRRRPALVLAPGRGRAGDRARRDGPHGAPAEAHRRAGPDDPSRPADPRRRAAEAAQLTAGLRTAELFSRGAGGVRALRRGDRPGRRPAGQVAVDLRGPGHLAVAGRRGPRAAARSPPPPRRTASPQPPAGALKSRFFTSAVSASALFRPAWHRASHPAFPGLARVRSRS